MDSTSKKPPSDRFYYIFIFFFLYFIISTIFILRKSSFIPNTMTLLCSAGIIPIVFIVIYVLLICFDEKSRQYLHELRSIQNGKMRFIKKELIFLLVMSLLLWIQLGMLLPYFYTKSYGESQTQPVSTALKYTYTQGKFGSRHHYFIRIKGMPRYFYRFSLNKDTYQNLSQYSDLHGTLTTKHSPVGIVVEQIQVKQYMIKR